MVERSAVNRVVAGSSPARGAIFIWAHSSAVEQSAHNRSVPGSNPGGPTILSNIFQKQHSLDLYLINVNIRNTYDKRWVAAYARNPSFIILFLGAVKIKQEMIIQSRIN